jgi:predicted metal-dependent hydrolase
MIKEIVLNGKTIEYDLQRKDVKNVNLRIKADRTISVSANDRVPERVIEDFIESKSEYILKALAHYEELAKYAPKPKQYLDGESFRILGHDRRLKIIEGNKNNVEYDESYIMLTVKDSTDFTLKKKLIDRWLMSICKDTIQSLCDAIYPKFQKYEVAYPTIRYRNMVSRWGSCQPKRGILTFNYTLVEAPISCIEYVVVHEFTHFLQPNHSKKFYQQLAMFMPDWEVRKKILEKGNTFVE